MTPPSGDRGDIVLGWLTRLAVVLAVLGLVVFDGVALVAAHFQAADAASAAARSAAEEFRTTRNVQKAYDAAYAEVAASGDTVGTTDFVVSPQGAVRLTVHRSAHTLVVHRIGPLRRFAEIDAAASGTATS